MSDQKTPGELLREKLFLKQEHAGKKMSDGQIDDADLFCEHYKSFLNTAKTEREAVTFAVSEAEKHGFVPFVPGQKYAAGDKVFVNNRGKAAIFAVIGQQSVSEGVNISAAHVDVPRLDLKPNPLYEDHELALFKTHYYGGIKKYQWTAVPLALHGVIIKSGGEKITVNIGEDPQEPCFVVTDLLPHLSAEQFKRPANELIKGEELNLLVGSRPFRDDKASERVKLNILNLLFEKYGMIERDFLSAELEAVPLFPVRDVGLDRSLIGGYGHDDRVCAYTALRALLDTGSCEKTAVAVLTDKEETGSDGNTGLHSVYLQTFIYDLAAAEGVPVHMVLSRSRCLSADVNAAIDPTFSDVLENRNAARLNYGVCVTKYTGSRGKADTSDASAEYVASVCEMLDHAGVIWQTGELGKVDFGGGGTVAKYIANLDVDVVDVGVPVLSMHSPFEIVSKLDVFMAYRTFFEFFK